VLVSCALAASAQRSYRAQPAHKLPVRFGLRLGLNYSNTNFNQGAPVPTAPVATVWQPGFLVGALMQVDINRWFALQQEYVFSQQSGQVKGSGTQYQMRYLSLPLLLKYQVSPRLTVVGGPQVDLLVAAKANQGGQVETITHDTEERAVGATAGLEVRVWHSLSLSTRYLQGFNHVGIGQRSAVREFKWQSVQAAAEIRF